MPAGPRSRNLADTLPATLSEPGSGFIVPPLAERKIPIRPEQWGRA
jgi:hypothetical protein